jgi:hypothetical protein
LVQHAQLGMWEDLIWEQANTHAADLILVESRAGAMMPEEYMGIDIWASLPGVQAGQTGKWRTELPYSRASYATYLRELAETIRHADANVV